RLFLTGSLFQGISQASGGNTQDSSTNYPIVELRSLDSSQVAFLPVDPVGGWSDTSFISIPGRPLSPGPALVTSLPTVSRAKRNLCSSQNTTTKSQRHV